MIRMIAFCSYISIALVCTITNAQDQKSQEASKTAEQETTDSRYQRLTDMYLDTLRQGAYDQFTADREAAYFEQIGKTKPSPFWIGVQCEPVTETRFFSEELDGTIVLKGGLEISEVTNDSPAEAAGMQAGDIILFVETKLVATIDELIANISAAGESPMSGALVRDQKLTKFQVTPTQRSIEDKTVVGVDQFRSNFQYSWLYPAGLPKGYSATINVESGAEPEITIKKGDESWSSKNRDVSGLPQETRPFANSAISVLSPPIWYKNSGDVNKKNQLLDYSKAMGDYGKASQIWLYQANEDGINSKLNKLQEQIEELSKVVGELKRERD